MIRPFFSLLAMALPVAFRPAPEVSMNAQVYFAGSMVAVAEAAEKGEVSRLKHLLTSVDVNRGGKDGMSLLLWALVKGKKESFRCILEHGANPNVIIKDGVSVMSLSAIHENPDYLSLCLANRGDPNVVNPVTQRTPIFGSVLNLRFENLRILIRSRANLDFQDRTGRTAVMVAAALNRFDFVYAMVEAGANPLVRDNWGNSLINYVESKEKVMDPKHELFHWRARVIQLLKKE